MYIQYLSAKIQIQISKYVSRIQLIANLKLKKKTTLKCTAHIGHWRNFAQFR